MTFAEYRKKALETLSEHYSPQEAGSVFSILSEARGFSSYYYITSGDSELTDSDFAWFESALSRLKAGEPVSHVVGYKDFYGRRFRVTPDVLIPRGETEEMCREALNFIQNKAAGGLSKPLRILDLCTGSGCIGWTVALEASSKGIPVDVVCVDISEAALQVARSQEFECAKELFSINFVQADVLDVDGLCKALSSLGDFPAFDLILSNPPYVLESERKYLDPLVVDHDPSLALFVEDKDSQKFNFSLGSIASRLALAGGMMMIEINEKLGYESLDATSFCLEIPYSGRILKDLSGRDRFTFFRF